jgi:hypothetical protein
MGNFVFYDDEDMALWNWASNGPFVHPPDDSRVNMAKQCIDTDMETLKDLERNLSPCHSVHHKSQIARHWAFDMGNRRLNA